MKAALKTLAVAVVVIAALVGCSKKEEAPAPVQQAPITQAPAAETQAPIIQAPAPAPMNSPAQ
jgi:hypothetical protein